MAVFAQLKYYFCFCCLNKDFATFLFYIAKLAKLYNQLTEPKTTYIFQCYAIRNLYLGNNRYNITKMKFNYKLTHIAIYVLYIL